MASRSYQGLIQQRRERFFELMNEAGGVFQGIRRDKGPYFRQVVFGLLGYSEDAGNRCLPFCTIRSASKS